MATINNVTRFLESKKIRYTAFELPEEKLGAVDAAVQLGVPAELVYKTIVVVRVTKGKSILAMVPGHHEVDLKALARTVGEKKLLIPSQKEAEKLTGLKAGGISPLALLNRGFLMVLDANALDQELIYISGGQRGLNICLAPKDLALLVNAKVDIISRLPE